MARYTLSSLANGAGVALMSKSTSTGAPSWARSSITYMNASAFSVFAIPRDPALSTAVMPWTGSAATSGTLASAVRKTLAVRMFA